MPTIIPANNWEPFPENFPTGFVQDKPGPQITTEAVIASLDEVAKHMPIPKDLLFPQKE